MDDEPQMDVSEHSYRRRWIARGLSDSIRSDDGRGTLIGSIVVPVLAFGYSRLTSKQGAGMKLEDIAPFVVAALIFLALSIVWQILRAPGRMDQEMRRKAEEIIGELEKRPTRQLIPSYSASGDLIVVNVQSPEDAAALIKGLESIPTIGPIGATGEPSTYSVGSSEDTEIQEIGESEEMGP